MSFLIYSVRDYNCVAAYWEIVAHSAYDMFSLYMYKYVMIIVNLVLEWEFLIAPYTDHFLILSFNAP